MDLATNERPSPLVTVEGQNSHTNIDKHAENRQVFNPEVSVFSGINPIPLGNVRLAKICDMIRAAPDLKSGTEAIRKKHKDAGGGQDGKSAITEDKKLLPGVTFAGTFVRRSNDNLVVPTQLVQFDLDGLSAEQLKRAAGLLRPLPYVVILFISPSGEGLKGAIRVEGITDPGSYRTAWEAVTRFLASMRLINDPTTKDLARLAFLAHDSAAHYNPNATVFPLDMWLQTAEEVPAVPAPVAKPAAAKIPREKQQGDVIDRARKYIAVMPPAIAGQGGHDATYAVAVALVNGFDLAEETALDLLAEYNARCVPPWSDYELQHKLDDAQTKPHNSPRGYLLNAPIDHDKRTSHNDDTFSDDAFTPEVMPRDPRTLDTKNPYAAAQRFAHERQHAGNRLILHRGTWKSYRGTHYADISTDGLRAQLYRYADGSKKPNGEPVHASQNLVGNIADALRAAVHLDDGDMPRWIGADDHEGRNYIAFRNGLLDVGQFIEEPKTEVQPHTSDWFSVNVLPFDYDADAECPNWETFMAQVSGGDPTWIAGLAMMFGYLLSSDTSQQKCFLLQGAPRSGKGTIARILCEMLGKHNVAAPSLASLAGEFGLAPMIGKTAAIIGDASSPKGTEATRSTEIIKGGTGEDAFTINAKFKDQQTMRLTVRFVILCNQLLDMPDASGALANRMILFPFRESFLGREDLTLEKRLLDELPGILQWSLRGLRALRKNGKLIQPESGNQARADFARLSSPVRGFIDDRLVCEPGARVTTADAYNAWRGWCEAEGHQSGSANVLGSKLVAAQPEVRRLRVGPKTCREWAYLNIRLAHSGDLLGHAGPLGHGEAS